MIWTIALLGLIGIWGSMGMWFLFVGLAENKRWNKGRCAKCGQYWFHVPRRVALNLGYDPWDKEYYRCGCRVIEMTYRRDLKGKGDTHETETGKRITD